MQNEYLFLKHNERKIQYKAIQRKLQFRNMRYTYSIKTKVFNGDHILEILSVITFLMQTYRQKVPVTIYVSECEFYDKLVYIILESIFYYLYKDLKYYNARIVLKPTYNIYTEGMNDSPLRNMVDTTKYIHDFAWNINKNHYRKLVPDRQHQKADYLSNMMQEIESFLINTGINNNVAQQMKEVLIELVGNAGEHGNSDCLIDIDVTGDRYRKEGNLKDSFYGMNVAIMNYSEVLFHEPLKHKFNSGAVFPERYELVKKAEQYHMNHLNDDYKENDFYTVASFQHRISGSVEKTEIGGTGLTSLLKSLEDQADTHLCYLLTGNRVFFFEKEKMNYDENNLVGFNKEGRFIDCIPDSELFQTISTFLPGVAYNLNYAFKKEAES